MNITIAFQKNAPSGQYILQIGELGCTSTMFIKQAKSITFTKTFGKINTHLWYFDLTFDATIEIFIKKFNPKTDICVVLVKNGVYTFPFVAKIADCEKFIKDKPHKCFRRNNHKLYIL